MLVEEGFSMTSVDLSDKMLKYALKTRWNRRKESSFDDWVIEEANWLTLTEDLNGYEPFDAVVCLGNSFAHLPDISGDQSEHKKALKNFAAMVKPGGILLVDHRNYDAIIDKGVAPSHNIYYNSNHMSDIKTSVLYVNGNPKLVTLDYMMEVEKQQQTSPTENNVEKCNFRLSYYPHRMKVFAELLKEAFGPGVKHQVYGDFQPMGSVENPGFYIHVIEKPSS